MSVSRPRVFFFLIRIFFYYYSVSINVLFSQFNFGGYHDLSSNLLISPICYHLLQYIFNKCPNVL